MFLTVDRCTMCGASDGLPLLLTLLVALANLGYSIPIDNGLVDSSLVKNCSRASSADVIVLLDGSGSVGESAFRDQLRFIAKLVRALEISANGTHVGVIQYSERARVEIALGQYNDADRMESGLEGIQWLGGGTATGAALKLARERMLPSARANVAKVLVILTDGQSQDEVVAEASRLRDADVLLFAIGVTGLIDVHQLHQMTGNALRVFTVEAWEELSQPLADSITWEMCTHDFHPGVPEIICGPDRIGVRARVKQPFDGWVFVADHWHEPACRLGPAAFPDPTRIGLSVPFSTCNVHRYRSLNPRGIFVETSVVFMFHTLFMTKVDQTVRVKCFYMEAEKDVTVPLQVSMLTTQFREAIYEMPVCEYTLRRGSADGPLVDYATLGEHIFHRWECKEKTPGADAFGMLVHSCYVDNGFGDRVDVLDRRGCGLDAVLLGTPTYDKGLHLATREYHVFKYADRPVLQFQCQVTLCLKMDGGCKGITPPDCAPTPVRHKLGQRRAKRAAALSMGNDYSQDVFTQPITVLDNAWRRDTEHRPGDGGVVNARDRLSQLAAFGVPLALTALNSVVCLLSLCVWLSLSRRVRRRSPLPPLPKQ